jgi:hypothetical protein
MTSDEQYLKWLIRYAVRRGYKNMILRRIYKASNLKYIVSCGYYQVVFDVFFSQALWGNKDHYGGRFEGYSFPEWKWQMRKMATCGDPLEYIKTTIRRP